MSYPDLHDIHTNFINNNELTSNYVIYKIPNMFFTRYCFINDCSVKFNNSIFDKIVAKSDSHILFYADFVVGSNCVPMQLSEYFIDIDTTTDCTICDLIGISHMWLRKHTDFNTANNKIFTGFKIYDNLYKGYTIVEVMYEHI